MASLDQVCAARLPRLALTGLAELRTVPTLTVIDADEHHVWLRWPAGDVEVLRQVLPLSGAELFVKRGPHWFRADSRLPTEGPPAGDGRRLDRVLQPAPFQAEPPPELLLGLVPLRLVRDGQPRSATALRCSLGVLADWADWAPTAGIVALRGACFGDEALLIGEPLPWLAGGERFWGRRVLVPLGWRPEPALPESALVLLVGLEPEQIAVLHEDGVEVIPESALQRLTRGNIRRARPAQEAPA